MSWDAAAPGIAIDAAAIPVGNVTSYLHEGLPPDTTIFYRVAAVNAEGVSDLSNEVCATLPP